MMTDWKFGMVLSVTLIGVLLVVSTHGTAGITGSRSVDISVADESEHPYLGVDVHSPELSNGTHEDVPLLTIRNDLGYDTTLRVTATVSPVTDTGQPPVIQSEPRQRILRPGEEEVISIDVVCGGNEYRSEEVTLEVDVSGSEQSISFTRDVTITCTGTEPI